MDSADKAGAGGVSEQAVRYIITRPCLAEGSLRLLKYLQPLFPDHGQLVFVDSRGERFPVTVDAARGRLYGLGELYRAHNMGVNDVLLLTPGDDLVYSVECVVKPHARGQSALTERERPAPKPPVAEKRVVIHATPHVREVRMERVSPEPAKPVAQRPAATATPADPVRPAEAAPASAGTRPGGVKREAPDSVQPKTPASGQPTPPPVSSRPAASIASSVAVIPATVPTPTETVTLRATAVLPATERAAAPLPQGQLTEATATAVRAQPATPAVLQRPVAAPVVADPRQNSEDRLAALARLTGYTCEHPGSGVVRLRAELGSHGYSVLIATTPDALNSPAWSEGGDYMALLTDEDERPQGIPRFTHAALEALLEHARLAPLTPIDLRGYWNTGSFDRQSVDSVAELVSAHLAQRGSFSHVLLTLAQQPAHSLVHVPRLAERLGSGVNTAELHSILETLSRPPFLALTPLPGGQYYLRSDVRDLLQEFGAYAEGMRRRIKPAPLAAAGR